MCSLKLRRGAFWAGMATAVLMMGQRCGVVMTAAGRSNQRSWQRRVSQCLRSGVAPAGTAPRLCRYSSGVTRGALADSRELDSLPGSGGLAGLGGYDTSRLPTRYKGTAFDEKACKAACESLAASLAAGKQQHVDDLMVALRLMMPPASGAELAQGPPRDDFVLRPEVLKWSERDYLGGLEENQRLVQEAEAEFATMMANEPEGFRAPEILAAGLDLAVAYLKNYALDKADTLYMSLEGHCMARGLPWDVKYLQDLATLRCKQHRQAEAAPLLEEVAKRTPPHSATLRNLGTVYNQLRQFDKAKEYFDAAAELVGDMEKEDLWNIGIVHKNKKEYQEAVPMLEKALAQWLADEPEDDVTLAKLYDTLGSCYDEMGRHDDAIVQLEQAKALYSRSIGQESPLYGSACERLTRALVHAGQYEEGLEALVEAFTVIAMQDSVHPTPLFELLGIALEEIPIAKAVALDELAKLEVPIEAAVYNMHYRGLDRDANAGVLFERMARALTLCSMARGDAEQQEAAARRRGMARSLLKRAAPVVEAATKDGLADLTHITMLINTELQALDSQDALYRVQLPGAQAAALEDGAPQRPAAPF
eukprot:TRINITY_DN42427_c0_g3_i1.p1 TRINITY_DN42427_c0_g3~~TRINITY_DN42427_c0_g3_i1.p1  ORF type:complete len:592 (-),score=189.25 TRINITY_DN42427_c0_g3_i1:46-1821(-)